MGNGEKRVFESELPAIIKMGKKLIASRGCPPGHVSTREDLSIRSPGGGISPSLLNSVIGKKLKMFLMEDEDLTMEHLE